MASKTFKPAIKLLPSFKQKWLKALRSGKFKQTTGRLADYRWAVDDKNHEGKTVGMAYCCLGVACQVVSPMTLEQHRRGPTAKWDRLRSTPGDKQAVKMFGRRVVGDANRWQDVSGVFGYLIRMNDNDKASFKKIAQWIERNL